MSPPLLSLERITIRYGRAPAISGVDLTVARGEIVTVIGPNGSGKTSLVRAAVGLIEPDEGTITRAPGLRVGYVPQTWNVENTLPITVRRFLTLMGARDASAVAPVLA